MFILILAGGSGTRLWPVSRKNKPKQISEILGTDKTMIEQTWKRLRNAYPAKNIFICTNGESAKFIRKVLPELPKNNLIIEPFAHGTAAAIGYSASYIHTKYGNVPLFVASADHYIKNEKTYSQVLRQVEQALKKHPTITVLVGVKPSYAETGYGYIKIRNKNLFPEPSRRVNFSIFKVEKFIEKPSLEKAREYVKSGNYLWNAGMFGWNTGYLLNLYRKHLPKTHKVLSLPLKHGRKAQFKNFYRQMDATSIDYGILEKEKNILVVPAVFDWADIGHWRTVHELLRGKPDENVVRGKHIQIDSSGNLIYSTTGRLIATAGLRDTVIIETNDAILVCPRDKSQDVKKITELLKQNRLKKYL